MARKSVPERTYNMLSGTLSLYTTTTIIAVTQLHVSWKLLLKLHE